MLTFNYTLDLADIIPVGATNATNAEVLQELCALYFGGSCSNQSQSCPDGSALSALPNIGTGNVAVSASLTPTVTFQGALAGLNAGLLVKGQDAWWPRRDQAYLGVMVEPS